MKGSSGESGARQELLRTLANMAERGEAGVLATVTGTKGSSPRHAGSKMIVFPGGAIEGTVGGGLAEAEIIRQAREVLEDNTCRTVELDLRDGRGVGVCGGNMTVFLEPVAGGTPFLVIGAGHVGRAVVEMGAALPLRFTLIDDRPEMLDAVKDQRGVQRIHADPAALPGQLEIPSRAALLVASRDHALDRDYLAAVLDAEREQQRELAFLGVLGSRTKVRKLRDSLSEPPWRAQRLEGVRMPVGLALGAETPAEIALSVLAEAQAVLRGGNLLTDDEGRTVGVGLHGAAGGKK